MVFLTDSELKDLKRSEFERGQIEGRYNANRYQHYWVQEGRSAADREHHSEKVKEYQDLVKELRTMYLKDPGNYTLAQTLLEYEKKI